MNGEGRDDFMDATRQLARRAFFYARGREPTAAELNDLVTAETVPEISYRSTPSVPGTQRFTDSPASELENALPRTTDDRETWLSPDQLREAEAVRWFADRHGIESILSALEVIRHIDRRATLESCIREFLLVRRCEGVTHASVLQYGSHLRRFAAAFPGRAVAGIGSHEITSYLMQWEGRPASRRHRQSQLASFFAWAVRMRYTMDNPVENALARPRVDPGRRVVLTPEETRNLLRRAKESDVAGSWVLTLFAGMRTVEVLRFGKLDDPWAAIHFGAKLIEVSESVSKTGSRSIRIQPVLESWLQWLKSRGRGFAPTSYWLKRRSLLREALPTAVGQRQHREMSPANIGRRSFISYLLALPDASYAAVADQVGNHESILRRHYVRKVSQADAIAYFDLSPENL